MAKLADLTFNFSRTQGYVSVSNYAGTPFYIQMLPHNYGVLVTSNGTYGETYNTQSSITVFVNIGSSTSPYSNIALSAIMFAGSSSTNYSITTKRATYTSYNAITVSLFDDYAPVSVSTRWTTNNSAKISAQVVNKQTYTIQGGNQVTIPLENSDRIILTAETFDLTLNNGQNMKSVLHGSTEYSTFPATVSITPGIQNILTLNGKDHIPH